MKVRLILGIVIGVAAFLMAVVILAMFYYRPTFEWVR
jgi:hypothetical protein